MPSWFFFCLFIQMAMQLHCMSAFSFCRKIQLTMQTAHQGGTSLTTSFPSLDQAKGVSAMEKSVAQLL